MSTIRSAFLSFLLAIPSVSNATIVNVDATWEFYLYRYSPIQFEAGQYRIYPVGVREGGAFNAWNAWGASEVSGCDAGGTCQRGFLNSYSFGYVDERDFVQEIATVGGRVDLNTAIAYATPTSALANGEGFQFALNAPTYLYFYLRDFGSAYSDNTGGMSLRVEMLAPIPEPKAWTLLLSGLALVSLALRGRPNQALHRTRRKRRAAELDRWASSK